VGSSSRGAFHLLGYARSRDALARGQNPNSRPPPDRPPSGPVEWGVRYPRPLPLARVQPVLKTLFSTSTESETRSRPTFSRSESQASLARGQNPRINHPHDQPPSVHGLVRAGSRGPFHLLGYARSQTSLARGQNPISRPPPVRPPSGSVQWGRVGSSSRGVFHLLGYARSVASLARGQNPNSRPPPDRPPSG